MPIDQSATAGGEEERPGSTSPPPAGPLRRLVVPVLATVTLLAVVAATAGALRSRSLAAESLGDTTIGLGALSARWSQNVVVSLLAIAAMGSVVAGIWMLRIRARPGGEEAEVEEPLDPPPWWRRALSTLTPILLIVLLVVLVIRNSDPPKPPQPLGPGGAPPVQDVLDPAPQVDWWFVGLAVVLAGTAALVVARRWGPAQTTRRATAERADREAVLEAVDDSMDALLAEPDHRRAVVAAYARMESLLARAGVARAAWEAPTEYLSRVLAEAGVRTATVSALTHLFERARFSPHPVDAAMRQQALDALVALRAEVADAIADAGADAGAPVAAGPGHAGGGGRP